MVEVRPLRPGDPDQVGGHVLLGRIGEGGQGIVFLAHDSAGRPVAVKLLRVRLTHDATERFLRELRPAQRISESGLARVLHVDVHHGLPYLVSEYVNGISLRALVTRDGPRDPQALVRLGAGTAAALDAIHRSGIVHHDFKPSNVLLGTDGPRVIDFGIAEALHTATGLIGTPAYLAPEQLAGERAGPEADLWAWAVTLVFAATGRPAFGSGGPSAVPHRVRTGRPDLTGVPAPLHPIITACLDRDPARRPTAPEAMRALLDLDAKPAPHPRPKRPPAGISPALEPTDGTPLPRRAAAVPSAPRPSDAPPTSSRGSHAGRLRRILGAGLSVLVALALAALSLLFLK